MRRKSDNVTAEDTRISEVEKQPQAHAGAAERQAMAGGRAHAV